VSDDDAEQRVVRRVGLIGDVHCQSGALERALEVLGGERLDCVVCVGDIVDGPGSQEPGVGAPSGEGPRSDVERAIALLRSHEVATVRGNHDRWLLEGTMRDLPGATMALSEEARAWLASLPITRDLTTPLGSAVVCHGVGEDDMAVVTPDTRGYGLQSVLMDVRLREDDVFMYIGGHTHQRMVRPVGSYLFVNAGTLHPKYDPCFSRLDLDARTVTFYDLDPALRVTVGAPIAF
jgi:predicted phosphodiesterase